MSTCEEHLQPLFEALDHSDPAVHPTLIHDWQQQHPACAEAIRPWLEIDARLRRAPMVAAPAHFHRAIIQRWQAQRRHDRQVLAGLTVLGSSVSLVTVATGVILLLGALTATFWPSAFTAAIKLFFIVLHGLLTVYAVASSLLDVLTPWLGPVLLLAAGLALLGLSLGLSRNLAYARRP